MQDLRVVLIGKAYIFHADLTVHLRQFDCIRRVVQLRRGAHDLQKALKACRAVGKQLRKVRKLADGVDKGRDIERERQKIDGVHLPLHDEQAAHSHDGHGQGACKNSITAMKIPISRWNIFLGGLVNVVRAVEFFLLNVLVGECLGRANAGEGGFDVSVDRASLFLHAAGGLAHRLTARDNDRNEHRDHDRHDQCQPPLDCCHDSQRTHDGHERDEQVLRPVVGKFGDLKEVGRHAAHQLAGAVAVEKLKAQLLHMAEQGRADISLYTDAKGVAPVGDNEIQHRPQRIRCQHDQHDRKERAVCALRQQRAHGVTRDNGVCQIDHRHDQRAGHVEKNSPRWGLKKDRKIEKPDRFRYCSVVMIFAPFLIFVCIIPGVSADCKPLRSAYFSGRIAPKRGEAYD